MRIHKYGSSLGSSSESDLSSTTQHTSALCGPTLGQHRDALKNIPNALPDLTSTPHHSSVPKLHAPCVIPAGTGPCPSNEHLPNTPTSRKPEITPAPPLPVETSTSPSANYNRALLNILVDMLSSSANNTSSRTQSTSSPVIPSNLTSNSEPVPVQVPTTCSSSASAFGSSSSNVLSSRQPCGSPVTPVPNPQLPPVAPSTSFPIIPNNPRLTNLLLKLSSLIPVPAILPASKVTPAPSLCPLFTPALNKDSSGPVSKPKVACCPNVPPLGAKSPCIFCGLSKHKHSDSKPAQTFQIVPNSAPEEFPASIPELLPTSATSTPASTTVPPPTLAPVPRVNISTFSGHNSAVVNAFLKYLSSTQAPKSNTTVFTVTPPLVPIPPVPPTLAPGINSGYNLAFMKHLIKHLLYHSASIQPPPVAQFSVDTTPASLPKIPKPPTGSNGTSSALNHGGFDISPNQSTTPAPAPTINQNASLTNNSAVISLLCKLLLSTSSVPNTTPSTIYSDPTSATTSIKVPPYYTPSPALSKQQFDLFTDILSKFSNILSGSTIPAPVPGPNKPSSVPKPFPEPPVPRLIPETPAPTYPPLLSGCHLKHLRPHHSSITRPLTPSLPSPCSLSHSKLSSGCKHAWSI